MLTYEERRAERDRLLLATLAEQEKAAKAEAKAEAAKAKVEPEPVAPVIKKVK
jgi:hypothetical protein